MARKTLTFTQNREGRDKGKQFHITEMSAWDTERWAHDVLNAMASNATRHEAVQLLSLGASFLFGEENRVDDIEEATRELALMGFNSIISLPSDSMQRVLAPLLDCVSINLDPGRSEQTAALNEANVKLYVEEAITLSDLRLAAFRLHTGFFFDACRLILKSPAPESPPA